MNVKIVTPWHNTEQRMRFLHAWNCETSIPDFLVMQQDVQREGCAITKNKGIARAMDEGADIIIVLDDDCFPAYHARTFDELIAKHVKALEPQPVKMFETVTNPPSRGTPYFNHTVKMPVAASMGFWEHIGDYDAPAQLVRGPTAPMEFKREAMFGRYFPLCGMNLAFRSLWWPYCKFINVARFDDIWQGFIWQKHAYANGYCFNLGGPVVKHSRQSNVWANLRDEANHLEDNETVWQAIHASASTDYETLLSLLPPL